MKKRILCFTLILCLTLSLVPAAQAAEVPEFSLMDFDGLMIEITPQRVEDTFQYLNEFYIQQHPEAALLVSIGDRKDQAVLAKLADIITDGLTTDWEKAQAINDWLVRNITYVKDDYWGKSSAYPNDTFYNRTGNCVSFAVLMQTLLRLEGIPAVWGTGWREDMTRIGTELFTDVEGHAWCFVYLDGEWVLFDPLWIDTGTTNREYMARWMYFDDVEFVVPASDPGNLPSGYIYYTDGIIYNYSPDAPTGFGNTAVYCNNIGANFTTNQCTDTTIDGWYYLDGTDKTQMRQGEVYRNGWISYGNYSANDHRTLTYAHANGMQIVGTVMELNGTDYYMDGNSAYPILAEEADYSIQYGTFTLMPGYTGPFLDVPWGSGDGTFEFRTEWISLTPEIAEVDQSGIITCHMAGLAEFQVELHNETAGGIASSHYLDITISDEVRVADYTDHIPEPEPEPEPEPVGSPFTDVKESDYFYAPVLWAVANNITGGIGNGKFGPNQSCTRGQIVTFLWAAAGRPEPVTTENPFTDVKTSDYFYKAVLWAVENNITSGVSADRFGPGNTCTRGQVATFLWAAMGRPEPHSSTNPFTDVKESDYYYKAVLWAVENGITSGVGAGRFGPGNTCTRGQIVTFLHKAFG